MPSVSEPKQVAAPVSIPVKKPDAPIALPPSSMVSGGFQWQADKPHYVMMVLEKTDGVYVNEARNAFMRFNRTKFSNRTITINKDALSPEKRYCCSPDFPMHRMLSLILKQLRKRRLLKYPGCLRTNIHF